MKTFFAALVLALALSTVTAQQDGQVLFQFYYESLCPGCYSYLQQVFKTAVYTTDLTKLFTTELYPYGNARETQSGSEWVFNCQHGESECEGNMLEACVLDSTDDEIGLKAIICIEANEHSTSSWDSALDACALEFSLDTDKINQCRDSAYGNNLMHQIAVATDNLVPPHQWTPWLVVNNSYNADEQDEFADNPVKFICDNYSGPASTKASVAACDQYSESVAPQIEKCYKSSALEYLMN